MIGKWVDKTTYPEDGSWPGDPSVLYLSVPELYDDLILRRSALHPVVWVVSLRKGALHCELQDMPYHEAQWQAKVALLRHLRILRAAYDSVIEQLEKGPL